MIQHHFAVIPTLGERNHLLIPTVNQLLAEGVAVIIVENGETIPTCEFVNGGWTVVNHDWIDEPVNLSKLWNMGLDVAEEVGSELDGDYVVAVLNDDLSLPPGFVHSLGNAIDFYDAAGAFPSNATGSSYVLRDPVPVPLNFRMAGFAFALRGSAHLRADESLKWWYGDDDLDWRIRMAGGNVGAPFQGIVHHDPNGYTARRPELGEQAGRDRQTFEAKWGRAPW